MLAATIVFFGGFAVMIFFIVKRQRLATAREQKGLSESSRELQAELEKTADFVVTRLEERIQHLQYLIAEADERIIRLESHLEDDNKSIHDFSKEDEKPAVMLPEPEKENLLQKQVQPLLTADNVFEGRKKVLVGAEELGNSPSDIRTEVFSLLNEGKDFDTIAKKTGLGKGAISLLAQMHKRNE